MTVEEQKAERVIVNQKDLMPQTLSRREQECCHAKQTRCGLKRGSCGGRTVIF